MEDAARLNNASLYSKDLIIKKSDLSIAGDGFEDIKMNAILEDVLMLIARLEFDRRHLEQQLKSEKALFQKLKTQIESTSQRRALLLPEIVQKEHESQLADIAELKFHILFNTKSEEKLVRKVDVEEKVHERLNNEMKNITSTLPLIEEKISIEVDLLHEVDKEQQCVDDLLKKAYERKSNAEERTVAALDKARMEREEIQAELDQCKRELNKAK